MHTREKPTPKGNASDALKSPSLEAIRSLNLKSLVVSSVVFFVAAFIFKLGFLAAGVLAVLAEVVQLV